MNQKAIHPQYQFDVTLYGGIKISVTFHNPKQRNVLDARLHLAAQFDVPLKHISKGALHG